MNKSGLLGEVLEKGKSTLGDIGQSTKSQITGFGKATVGQVSPGLLKKTNKQQIPGEEAEDALRQKPEGENQSVQSPEGETEEEKRIAQEHARDMVKHLYGVDDGKKEDKDKKQNQPGAQAQQAGQKKSPSEEEKIQELKRSLHQEYYQRLTTPSKPSEEERPAEKVEKEKQMEDLDQQKRDKEKPPPLAIQRSQQKAEKFPGASG